MRLQRLVVLVVLAVVLPVLGGAARKGSIVNTKHNLAVSGRGEIKSVSRSQTIGMLGAIGGSVLIWSTW